MQLDPRSMICKDDGDQRQTESNRRACNKPREKLSTSKRPHIVAATPPTMQEKQNNET